eukprot:tig00020911_g15769.t1
MDTFCLRLHQQLQLELRPDSAVEGHRVLSAHRRLLSLLSAEGALAEVAGKSAALARLPEERALSSLLRHSNSIMQHWKSFDEQVLVAAGRDPSKPLPFQPAITSLEELMRTDEMWDMLLSHEENAYGEAEQDEVVPSHPTPPSNSATGEAGRAAPQPPEREAAPCGSGRPAVAQNTRQPLFGPEPGRSAAERGGGDGRRQLSDVPDEAHDSRRRPLGPKNSDEDRPPSKKTRADAEAGERKKTREERMAEKPPCEGFKNARETYEKEMGHPPPGAESGQGQGQEQGGAGGRRVPGVGGLSRSFRPRQQLLDACKGAGGGPEARREAGPAAKGSWEDPELPKIIREAGQEIFARVSLLRVDPAQLKGGFDTMAGLEEQKRIIKDAILRPLLYRQLYRNNPDATSKGALLFGPPGTGKTLIARALACEAKASFFSVTASSITSKWIGEGEKTVAVLLEYARYMAPAIVFLDEADSLLNARGESSEGGGDGGSMNRVRTEFLSSLDGLMSDDRLVVFVAATNRPENIDEAARRRWPTRVYIPLPDAASRRDFFELTFREWRARGQPAAEPRKEQLEALDVRNAAQRMPLSELIAAVRRERHVGEDEAYEIASKEEMSAGPIEARHLAIALHRQPRSVSPKDVERHERFGESFGCKASGAEEAADPHWFPA